MNKNKSVIINLQGVFTSKVRRGRIRFFAKWAKIKNTNELIHTAKNNVISYENSKNEEYYNHIEMAGEKCAIIISYGVDKKGELRLFRHAVFPNIRRYPNDTHSSFDNNFKGVSIYVNDVLQREKVDKFDFDGRLRLYTSVEKASIIREICPSMTSELFIEKLTIKNKSNNTISIDIKKLEKDFIVNKKQIVSRGKVEVFTNIENETIKLGPNEEQIVIITYGVRNKDNLVDLDSRKDFLSEINTYLKITTPNEILNTMVHFAKIRASESIFNTKAGYMHSPGGGGYYGAIWTNDQCEYVNPLFSYLGYKKGLEQAKNSFKLFSKYAKKENAVLSSIIACGDGVWHGAGDRGDSAMFAYGLSFLMMALGDMSYIKENIKFVDNALDYTISKINSEGVVESDSDELENRFLSGKANLCTSCLAYIALINGACIHKDLSNTEKAKYYTCIADKLKDNIIKYFSKNVEGYDTFMYCKEEKNLRSWICMPMTVGINERVEDTIRALMSNKLRKGNGLLTRSGERTFWDRSALYALRGMFMAGYSEDAYEFLLSYSKVRLLGNHPPYAVEAFPEGNQAQLSAESGLYVRIFIEGILGLKFVGIGKFSLNPNLPKEWDYFKVENIIVKNKKLDIDISKNIDGKYEIIVKKDNEVLKSNDNVYTIE